MEERRACGKAAEDGTLELADVLPLAGDHRSARIDCLQRLTCASMPKRIERHLWRASRCVGDPDVERHRHRVVASLWRVMADRAGSVQQRPPDGIAGTAV